MSITKAQLVIRKAVVEADGASGGGRMSSTAITSGTKNNILPNVSLAERSAGITRYRKRFLHVTNTEELTLIDPKIFLDQQTTGDDAVLIFAGTQTDTVADLAGSERLYGTGKLDTSLTIGGQVVKVLTEGAAFNYFRNGDKIRISNMANVEATVGNDQYVTISSVPTYAGSVATFNILETIQYNFDAASTRVASLLPTSDMKASVTSLAVATVGSGDFDGVLHPIQTFNLSTIQQNWVLTVKGGGTQVNVVGDTVGDQGDFSLSTDISPANPVLLSAYFTLPVAGLSGTFANGDTISFTTIPNSFGIWFKQVVPPATNNLAGNSFRLGIVGESAQ